jgi:hypothetical protein
MAERLPPDCCELLDGGYAIAALALLPEKRRRRRSKLYSINRSFFRYTWLVVKWIVTIAAILFDTFFLGPWETAIMDISDNIGIAALQDPSYLRNQQMNMLFCTLQLLLLLATVFISMKPAAGLRQIS